MERGQNGGTEIRHDLQIEYIPFIVYEEQKDKLYTITEIKEEPYLQYHPYFSP